MIRLINHFNLQVPRHARQCNSLAWNPVENNLVSSVRDIFGMQISDRFPDTDAFTCQ